MKTWQLLIIAIILISFIQYSFSDVLMCTCTGQCHGRAIEQSVSKRYELLSGDEEDKCIERAKKAFGGHCGGLTDCKSDCVELDIDAECEDVKSMASSCCKEWCSGFSGDDEYCSCIQSCEALCSTNELSNQIISAVQYIAAIIVAIMLAVNGIKFITSDSPYDRDQAKQSIRYLITALVILAIVTYIITAMFFPVQVPGGDTSLGDDCASVELTPKDICLEDCTEPSCTDINSYISSAISNLGSSKSSELDSNFVLAVMKAESAFYHCSGGKVITSSAGALGLMQLMPGTATWLGVDPCDAEDNVKGGAKYLNFLFVSEDYEEYGSPKEITLAAYNCGQGNINDILTKQCISKGIAKSGCTWEGHVKDHIKDECNEGETLPYVSKIMGWYGSISCSK